MLRSTKSFVRGRMGHRPQQGMGRLYVVEPSHTTTGSNADNRLRLAARDIETYILALCKELSTKHSLDLGSFAALAGEPPPGVPAEWLTAVAADLVAHRGRSVVVAGSRQPARVHALVHAVNAALGNNNQTVHFYATTDETQGNALADIKQLAADLDGGKVDTLVVLGGNPAYDAPADLAFAQKLAKAKSSLHLGSHLDETGVLSSWYVPKAHDLEAWGDARAVDGSVSIMQPLIAPLHDGISEIQILGKLIGETVTGGSEAGQRSRHRTHELHTRVERRVAEGGPRGGSEPSAPRPRPALFRHRGGPREREARRARARCGQSRGELPRRPEAARRSPRQ
jgi:hypothetical protein